MPLSCLGAELKDKEAAVAENERFSSVVLISLDAKNKVLSLNAPLKSVLATFVLLKI